MNRPYIILLITIVVTILVLVYIHFLTSFFFFLKIYSVIDMLFHFLPNFKTLFIEMLSTGYLNIPCSVEFFKYTYLHIQVTSFSYHKNCEKYLFCCYISEFCPRFCHSTEKKNFFSERQIVVSYSSGQRPTGAFTGFYSVIKIMLCL